MSHDFTTTRPARHRGDALVSGGGPAGSTIATLLAEKGLQAAPLEKAHPPRFRIGESRLPVMAGDIFCKTPIWCSLRVSRATYYRTSLAILKRTILDWKRCKLNTRPLEATEEIGC
jgi:hypothetical protein